ncbi:MAG: hypothetical protein LBJ38_00330 [Oscillospiraceae bacterium]|jgi:hypothetical protein|nr:hypothetical protein [Oscillospiraceae bacterium]
MKSKRLFGLVMSFVTTITFCCSEAQVAAAGSPTSDGKAAVSKAVALVSTIGFGTLASLWYQKNEERKALADRLEQSNAEMLALRELVEADTKVETYGAIDREGLRTLLEITAGCWNPGSIEEARRQLALVDVATAQLAESFHGHLYNTYCKIKLWIERLLPANWYQYLPPFFGEKPASEVAERMRSEVRAWPTKNGETIIKLEPAPDFEGSIDDIDDEVDAMALLLRIRERLRHHA